MFFPSLEANNARLNAEQVAAKLAGHVQKEESVEDKDGAKEDKQEGAKEEPKETNFVFPDGGWECNKCQNYNFKGRKACYRCKKAKGTDDNEGKPEHMTKPKKGRKVRKDEAATNENSSVEFNRVKKDKKAGNQERVGDWVCQRCFNHNFSFRDTCNMCYMSQIESTRLLYQQQ